MTSAIAGATSRRATRPGFLQSALSRKTRPAGNSSATAIWNRCAAVPSSRDGWSLPIFVSAVAPTTRHIANSDRMWTTQLLMRLITGSLRLVAVDPLRVSRLHRRVAALLDAERARDGPRRALAVLHRGHHQLAAGGVAPDPEPGIAGEAGAVLG